MTRILVLGVETPLTDPEAEIICRMPKGMPQDVSSPAHWAVADLAVLAAGQGSADEGFDAVCVGDACDFGANALRSVLPIPVIGAGRAAMFYALTLGNTFAVQTDATRVHRIKKQIAEFGLAAHCTGVSTQVAKADVLIAADGAGAEIKPAPLSVSLALGLLGLGLSHSARTYPAPETPKSEMIQALGRALI